MTILEIIATVLMVLAVLLGLLRMLLGPAAPDRIVAADTLAMITTIVLTGFALWFETEFYLDVALIYATLSFVGIVALARSIEGGRA